MHIPPWLWFRLSFHTLGHRNRRRRGSVTSSDETSAPDERAEIGRPAGVVGDYGPGVRIALFPDCVSRCGLIAVWQFLGRGGRPCRLRCSWGRWCSSSGWASLSRAMWRTDAKRVGRPEPRTPLIDRIPLGALSRPRRNSCGVVCNGDYGVAITLRIGSGGTRVR